eukprot:7677464-Heterocapsa_arctica.AAC.1
MTGGAAGADGARLRGRLGRRHSPGIVCKLTKAPGQAQFRDLVRSVVPIPDSLPHQQRVRPWRRVGCLCRCGNHLHVPHGPLEVARYP